VRQTSEGLDDGGGPPNVIWARIFSFPSWTCKEHGVIAWIGSCEHRFFILFYKGEIFPARKKLLKNPDWSRSRLKISIQEAIQDRRLFLGGADLDFLCVVGCNPPSPNVLAIMCPYGALIALLAGGPKMGKVWRRSIIRRLSSLQAFLCIVGAMNTRAS